MERAIELRDIGALRLHPDAERVPLAGPEDLANLRSSLAEHGQQDPINVAGDVILDGRTRWTLLRELGSLTIKTREVDVPPGQQTNYIVDRALARRHLTAEQKRTLNGLLRSTVIEVIKQPKTGEEMRIGLGQQQRAAKLGVAESTVKNWDQRDVAKNGYIPSPDAPTHIRRSGGNTSPYPVKPAKPVRSTRGTLTRPKRTAPPWNRHFTKWCRAVLPEDKKFLLAMSIELHLAMGRLGLSCEQEENK